MNLKNPSMAGAVALVGVGLITLSGAIVFASIGGTAQASIGVGGTASAVSAAAMAQKGGEPVVVWMGVSNYGYNLQWCYHRLWSDGRLEQRRVIQDGTCGALQDYCFDAGWVEVPPPAGGDGFACRTDINGDRKTDAVDLAEVLAAWGNQGGCEPEPTYPCFNLTTPLGLQAMK
jgi:hypothetical protein